MKVCYIHDYSNISIRYDNGFYNAIFPILTYPMAGLSMTGSTYSCVAISIERYLGICHRNIKIHRKFRFYVVSILFLVFAIETPRFFELENERTVEGKLFFK